MYAYIETQGEQSGLFLKNENYSPSKGKNRGKNQSKIKKSYTNKQRNE